MTHPLISASRRFVCGLLAAVVVLALYGCASAKPATRYYLLNAQPTSEVRDACAVRLGAVRLPAYLQRNNIVLLAGDYEIVPALQHRWAEPLADGVERVLRSCLAASADHAAELNIETLHGEEAGDTVLETEVVLRDDAGAVDARAGLRFALTRRDAGYDALVRSHADVLLELCQALCALPAELAEARASRGDDPGPIRKRIERRED
ncbi:MAG: ABC-type transport auxiliary lipoprotein family protein [Pseudomonadota bacterium]